MDQPKPDPVLASPALARRPRRWLWACLAGLLALVLLVAASVGTLWWSAFSEPGAAWLLSKIPGLVISKPRGALGRDFEAERAELALPGGDKLVLTGFGWKGMALSRTAGASPWLRIRIDELYAQRVTLVTVAKAKTEPLQAPASLRLPVEVDIGLLRVGELNAAPLGEQPLRDLRAQVHLGADAGATHRVDGLSLAWGRLRASGSARIATDAAMPLSAQVELTQDATDSMAAWNSQASLSGPLQAPALRATLRAQPAAQKTGPARAQSLDLRATLRPFASWPLADLQASTQGLDLSAFHSAAPATSLSGEAVVLTQGLDQPVTVKLQLGNADAGRWNEGRLPVRSMVVELQGRANDARALTIRQLDAELGTQQQPAGRVQGQGRWTPQRWNVEATLTAVQPSLLDARASAMQFSGSVSAVGSGFAEADADRATVDLKTELNGQLSGAVLGTQVKRTQARSVQLKLDAQLNALRIELRDLQARSSGASATLSGQLTRAQRDAPWRVVAKASLVDFDPSPWWPGREDSPWRKGPHRLNAKGDVDLRVPPRSDKQPPAELLAALRGQAAITLGDSVLAGVPLNGELRLSSADGALATPVLKLDLAGNSLRAEGKLSTATAAGSGANDRWEATVAAPALARLDPLWQLLQPMDSGSRLAGSLSASTRVSGRWPDISTPR